MRMLNNELGMTLEHVNQGTGTMLNASGWRYSVSESQSIGALKERLS